MLLKRGIGISNAKTWLNYLHKWTMKVVINGKISTFLLPLVNPKIKKSQVLS